MSCSEPQTKEKSRPWPWRWRYERLTRTWRQAQGCYDALCWQSVRSIHTSLTVRANSQQFILHNWGADTWAFLQVGDVSSYSNDCANQFTRCGEIKRLVMGLDRFQKTPCGFCFVEYYNHQDALDCMKYIGGTKLDERIIRTDLDEGFAEGRQYGYIITL